MVGGLQEFNVSPSTLGPNWVFELGWAWAKGFGDRVLGTGLDNRLLASKKKQLTNPFKVLVVLVKEDYPINLLSGGTSTE